MQLVDQGAIDLDAEIQTYFPTFPEKEFPITVRHLMTHTSGIRHYNPGEMDMKDHFDTIEAAIQIFKDDPLLFEPGTQYSYSSYAWNIVAGIVENVSGQTFDDYLQQNVWGPSGMEVTYLEHQGDIVPNRVRQYVKREDAAGVVNAPFAGSLHQVGRRRNDRRGPRSRPLRARARCRDDPPGRHPRPDDDAGISSPMGP